MNDELTRPLGQKRPRQRQFKPVLAGLALTAAGVLAGWTAVSLHYTAPAPPAKTVAVGTPPLIAPKAEVKIEPPPARSAQTDDPDAPPIAEMVPDGTLIEKIPVPTPSRRQAAGLAHLPDPGLVERIDQGLLPKRSADGLRPMNVYSRLPDTEGNFGVARVVLIVGGMGISQTGSQLAVRQLPGAVTLAFAPYGNSLLRWMQDARKNGHELLLQVPMEPFDYPQNNPGQHTLLTSVEPRQNIAELHWAMTRITNYVGIVNFLGGKFIADQSALKPVFDEIASRGLLFVDDGSARNSATGPIAKASLLPYAKAGFQIDAVRTREAIARQLELLAQEAKRTGLAIGMANAFPETIELIANFAETANAKGIEITPVSAVVSAPEKQQ